MIKRIPAFTLLFLLLFSMFLFSVFMPKQSYSENENKYLATLPEFSLKSFWNGSFESKYATFLSDQFPWRNTWISVKSAAESLLLKTENNGIVYGKDGYLLPKFQSYDEEIYWDNLKSIQSFNEAAETTVHILVVPSAYTVLTEYVPKDLPVVDERSTLAEGLPLLSGCDIVDVWDVLQASQNDYVYYRTDHHWTTYGAYLAYSTYCGHAGLTPKNYDFKDAPTVTGFLGTSYSKCKKSGITADTISYFPVDAVLKFDGSTYDSLYDFTKISTRDKYAMFLYGNHAQSSVESGSREKKSLLIIKDSYADSMIPFLSNHYATIDCIDPRYYLGSIQELCNKDYDDILILLGFENLSCEKTWVKLSF